MIRAEEGGDHARKLERDKRERNGVPGSEDITLKAHVTSLASGQVRARVASLGHGRLNEGVEVSAAVQLVLDTKTPGKADAGRPLRIDLSLEVEGLLLVGNVSGGDKETKRNPKEECVNSQESAVVEQNSRPADQRSKQAEGGGNR